MDKFLQYLKAQLGSAYVWGAQGELVTDEFIEARETSQANINRAIAFCKKQRSAGITELRAYDCSGLIMRFLINEGIYGYDMSSRSLFAKSTEIKRDALQPGDLVFRHNSTKIYHVGVYMGNGLVIESKGRDHGVVEADINKWGKSYWNRYGRLPAISALKPNNITDTNDKEPVWRDLKLTSPNMRGDDVALLQEQLMCLGYDLGKWGADGIFGKQTNAAVTLFKARAAKLVADVVCDINMGALLGMRTER